MAKKICLVRGSFLGRYNLFVEEGACVPFWPLVSLVVLAQRWDGDTSGNTKVARGWRKLLNRAVSRFSTRSQVHRVQSINRLTDPIASLTWSVKKVAPRYSSTKVVPRWFDGVTNMKVAQGWRKSIGLAGDSAINWTRWYHKVPDQPLAMVSMIKHW